MCEWLGTFDNVFHSLPPLQEMQTNSPEEKEHAK